MNPMCGKACASADQMLAAAKADFEPDILDLAVEELGEMLAALPRCDIERQMRQQIVDQVGLVNAELVALAAAEERAARMCRRAVIRRRVAVTDIARDGHHRSVWYRPVQQPRPRLDRGDVHLLVMGMRALAVDAEPVERGGMRPR